jgi:hypothetical protein
LQLTRRQESAGFVRAAIVTVACATARRLVDLKDHGGACSMPAPCPATSCPAQPMPSEREERHGGRGGEGPGAQPRCMAVIWSEGAAATTRPHLRQIGRRCGVGEERSRAIGEGKERLGLRRRSLPCPDGIGRRGRSRRRGRIEPSRQGRSRGGARSRKGRDRKILISRRCTGWPIGSDEEKSRPIRSQ